MTDEIKTEETKPEETKCPTCDHVHTKEDGTCTTCGCKEGEKQA